MLNSQLINSSYSLADELLVRMLETSKSAGNSGDVELLIHDIERLKAGRFNETEFQNLCHAFAEDSFGNGCIKYNEKLFGKKSIMSMQMFNVLLESENAKCPVRSTEHAAGYDLFAPHGGIINPLSQVKVCLGIRTEFSPGWVGLIYDRSSWGVRGVLRLAGVIDSDYRNEWQVHLYNSSGREIEFKAGEKIAQVIFVEYGRIEPTVVSELSRSDRQGGFGSTGK